SPLAIMYELFDLYGVSGTGVDDVWIVDGTPPPESLPEAILRFAPDGWRDARVSEAEGGKHDRQEGERLLAEVWWQLVGNDPPRPQDGTLALVPFELTEGPAYEHLRAELYTFDPGPIRRLCVRKPIPLEDLTLRVEGNRLIAFSDTYDLSYPGMLSELPAVPPGSRFPRWHMHWHPRRVARAEAPLLTMLVSLHASSWSDVCSQLRGQTGVELRPARRMQDASVRARLTEVPFWIVLTALSAASGYSVPTTTQLPLYPFADAKDLVGAAFAALPAEWRLVWLLRGPHRGGRANLAPEVWDHLSESQRAQLGAGGLVMGADAPHAAKHWFRLTALQWLAAHVRATVEETTNRAWPGAIRGLFLVDPMGDVIAQITIPTPRYERNRLYLIAPFFVRPGPGQPRTEWMFNRVAIFERFTSATSGLLEAQRLYRPARHATYGTREATSAHTSASRGAVLVIAHGR
ncbi:MAG: hypothetical protein ACE5O2_12270, partial [Armatimonadota bacterium]